jgi:hypothetical protein
MALILFQGRKMPIFATMLLILRIEEGLLKTEFVTLPGWVGTRYPKNEVEGSSKNFLPCPFMGIPIQKLQKTSSFIIRSSPSFLYLYRNPLVFGLNHSSRNVGVIHECFTFLYSSNPLHECAPESFSYQGSLHICNATPSTVHNFFRPSQMVRSISLS